jgi:hypothetical protein
LKFSSGTNVVRNFVTRDLAKAKAREIPLGSGGQKVEGSDTPGLSVGDDTCNERASDAVAAPGRIDRDRAKECVVAANLQTSDADQRAIRLRNDECRQRVLNPVERKAAGREQTPHRG